MLDAIANFIKPSYPEIADSSIYSEDTFYKTFTKDLGKCRSEVIIESPFMTCRRVSCLLPTLKQLKKNRVKIIVNTRNPEEHDKFMCIEARRSLVLLLESGIQVIFSESLHRKTAILDRNVLWEGSLNIMSQNDSLEVMRRTESTKLAWQMVQFTKLDVRIN